MTTALWSARSLTVIGHPDAAVRTYLGYKQRLSETSSHVVALSPGRPRMRHEYTNEAFSTLLFLPDFVLPPIVHTHAQ